MNSYEIEELYYLYRQGCPIAQALLIEYCYWQIKMMMPAYCYTMTSYQSDYKDYLQVVIIRCLLALDNYRPDRGMQVRSFISMVIQNTISSLIVKNQGKVVRERQTLFSLDDYCSDDERIRYVDAIADNKSPDLLLIDQEQQKRVDAYILNVCSAWEQTVIAYHKCGFKDQDIALKLNKDIRSIYNANYRIQKKMENSNLFD